MPDLPTFPQDRAALLEYLTEQGRTKLPGVLGLDILEIGERSATMRCVVEEKHLALNGYLHAATIVALADTAAGFGCVGNLPPGGVGFTTLELKTNHVGSLLSGPILAEATMTHGGRTTQVWDVTVSAEESGKDLAYFRCTELILYPEE